MTTYLSAARDPSNYFNNAVPEDSMDFKYDTPKTQKYRIERVPRRLTPQNNSYSARGNEIIVFDLPNDAIYDFRESMVFMQIMFTGVGGTYRRPANGTWNLLRRIRHIANNRKVEESDNYGDVYTLKWIFEADPNTESQIGVDLLGINTQLTRNTWGADPIGVEFAIPINLGFLQSGYFPAKFLKERHQVELHLQDPNICIESDQTSLNFTTFNIRWHTFVVKDSNTAINRFGAGVDSEGFESQLKAYVESGNYQVSYDSWETFQNNVFAVNHDLVISHRAEAVKEIWTGFANINNRSNPLINDRLWDFPKLNIISWQFKMNGYYIPDIQVDCTGNAIDSYHHYIHTVNGWDVAGFENDLVDDPNVNLDDYNDLAFVIALDLKATKERKFIGSVSTLDHNTDPQLNVKFSVPPPAGYIARHYISYTTIAKIEAGTTRICIYE